MNAIWSTLLLLSAKKQKQQLNKKLATNISPYSSLHQQFTQCTDIKPPKTQHLQIAHVTYNASTPACTFVRLAGVSASLFRFIFFVTTYNHWLM